MTQSVQSIGVFTTDLELRVRSWDAWLEQNTGITANAAYHQPLVQLIPDIERRGLLARFRRVLSEGIIEVLAPAFHRYLIACPLRLPSKHFAVMQQWVTIAPLREEERIVGAIVTIEDVTARLERERDLAEQLDSPDEATRLRAAQALESETASAPMLVGALDDQSWRVRQVAVSGLMRHGGAETIATLLHTLRTEHQNPSVLNSALQVFILTDVDVVPPLIECLHSPDPDLRNYAALTLGDRRDPRAIPALIDALTDPDTNVRYHAIEALGKLRADQAVEPLIEIAETRDFFLAFPALDALSHIGERQVAPRLVALLDDPLLCAPVAEALGRLGDETAVPPLVALLNDSEPPTSAIVQALAALHEHYEATYGEGRYIAELARQSITTSGAHSLLAMLEQAHDSELRALVLVLGWLEEPEVQRTLAQLLGQPAVRKAVVEALVRHGTGVTELLIERLYAEELETRQAAVIALGRIGDPHAVPALIESLNDDPELVSVAADALGAIGDRRAFEALLGLIGHPAPAVRQAVVGALNSLGHPELAAHVAILLRDSNPYVRESAVKIAGYFGYPNCIDHMLECCNDPDERVCRAAVEHLPYFDEPRVLSQLTHALGNKAPGVRAAAARALAQIERTQALEFLLAALHDNDGWVRYFAARSIGQQGNSEALEAIHQLAQSDPASFVRIAAMEALGQIGSSQVVPMLVPFLDGHDPDLTRAALQALGMIRHPEALPPLEHILRVSGPARRIDLMQILAKRGGADSIPLLQQAASADSNEGVAQAAIEALAQNGSEAAIAALLGLLTNPERREIAITALAHLNEARIPLIASGLSEPNPAIRSAVIEVLLRMKRPRASEYIRAALDDPEATVRLAAALALRQLGSRYAERQLALLAHSDPDLAVRRAAHAALQR